MKDKKNILIVVLLIAVVALSYGVVSYSSKDVQKVDISEIKEWDVAITNVEIITEGEGIDGDTKYSEGTLVVNPILNDISDEVIYRVTIENNGKLDALLKNSIYRRDIHSLLVYDIEKPTKVIKSGEQIVINIRAYMDKDKYQGEKNVTNKLTALYEFVQNK